MKSRPLEVLVKAAVHDLDEHRSKLSANGWDAQIMVNELTTGRVEVVLVITLPEVLVPVEAA